MLRITELSKDDKSVTLRLEGKVTDMWIPELETICLYHRKEKDKRVVLDFSGVTFISKKGVRMLKSTKDEQVSIINCSLFIDSLLCNLIKNSKTSYSAGNKVAAIPGSSAGKYSNSNGILDHKELSDEELVRRFVETHNEEAFSEIVNRYGDKIFRTALRITRNSSDAEDILQEVFVTLIEKLNTFHEDSKFSTWLYRVAANASYIHYEAQERYRNVVSLEEYVSYDEDGTLKGVEIKDSRDRPDEVFFSKEGMEMIEKAVNELPERSRVIFHLRDLEGFSNEDVAEVLGLSVPAVKFRIHRARLFLRDKLSDYFYEWKK